MAAAKPKIKDIAAKLGISPTTVSFVLNGRDKGISRETADRIIRTACAMGYIRSSRMHMKNWRRVVYVIDRIAGLTAMTTFYQEVYNHLQALSEAHQIEILMRELDSSAPPEVFFRQYEALLRQDFDIYLTHNRKIAEILREKGAKVILCQGGALPDCICIYCDDLMAGRLAAEHALEMGHTTAGTIFFGGCANSPRYHGFCEQFLKNGGNLPEKFHWLIPTDHDQAAAIIAEKVKAATIVPARNRNVTEPLPSFFYCFADNILFPAIRGFLSHNLKVPDQVSLFGTDNLYWGKVATPAFSTIDLQEELFAVKVLQAIKEATVNYIPYQLAVPVRLLPRETVRKLV